MTTVTITSQGQITIPASVRKAWGIQGSQELQVTFDSRLERMTIEKPLTMANFRAIADRLTKKIPKGVKPLEAGEIHEFYERERTKEIVARMKDC